MIFSINRRYITYVKTDVDQEKWLLLYIFFTLTVAVMFMGAPGQMRLKYSQWTLMLT